MLPIRNIEVSRYWFVRAVFSPGGDLERTCGIVHQYLGRSYTHLFVFSMLTEVLGKVSVGEGEKIFLPIERINLLEIRMRVGALLEAIRAINPSIHVCMALEPFPDIIHANKQKYPLSWMRVTTPSEDNPQPLDGSMVHRAASRNQSLLKEAFHHWDEREGVCWVDGQVIANRMASHIIERHRAFSRGEILTTEGTTIFEDGIHPTPAYVSRMWQWACRWIYPRPTIQQEIQGIPTEPETLGAVGGPPEGYRGSPERRSRSRRRTVIETSNVPRNSSPGEMRHPPTVVNPGALADEAVGAALLHLTRRLQETGNPRATLDEAKELFQHSLDRL